MQQQLNTWKEQSVDELMGPGLWRIYCLLAGHVDDVVHTALDWRTALGMYLFFGSTSPVEGESGLQAGLRNVIEEFQKAFRRHGANCHFRPASAYAFPKVKTSQSSGLNICPSKQSEPLDMQFNIICLAAELIQFDNLSSFDYCTHQPQPMEVAFSWHVCLLLIALCKGDMNIDGFQLLTHQYCLRLELAGHLEWAIYVAHFICDESARGLTIRGLIHRNVVLHPDGGLKPKPTYEFVSDWTSVPGLVGVPEAWWCSALALRCEVARDWLAATGLWLKSGNNVQRASILLLGFLTIPAVLKHTIAPAERKPTEALLLQEMQPFAHWLFAVLQQFEPSFEVHNDAWAQVGTQALLLMRAWSAKKLQYSLCDFAGFSKNCEELRRHSLGIPW